MIDIKHLRENLSLYRENEKKKNKDHKVVDEVLEHDLQWRKDLKSVENLKHQRNVVSQEINQAKKDQKEAEAHKKIKQMREVVEQIKQLEEKATEHQKKRDELILKLGNLMSAKVPYGNDDSENKEIKQIGKKPKFNFPLKTHVELCESLELADFDASAKTSGNGFYFLKNELAWLNQALIQFTIDFMRRKKYTYIEPPLLIRKEVLGAAVNVEEFAKTIYSTQEDNLALIGTSEHALLGIHAQETLPEDQLPKKYYSYSMCFRKEVGSHGINEKGLWRTHQFNKVEQFIFCKPEDSEKYFDELLKNSEEILKALQLPYRVIEICSGDLADWKFRSFDLEVWRPTTQSYGEVMSLSNCTDYQARKLGIRVVLKNGERPILHTLNNTALATSRIMVAILENFQTKNGTVKVPKVLHSYMHGIKELGLEIHSITTKAPATKSRHKSVKPKTQTKSKTTKKKTTSPARTTK